MRRSNSDPWHGTDDDAAVELAVRERALLVGARVLERDPAVGRPAEADRRAFDLDAAEEPHRGVLRRADAVPGELGHDPLL